MKAKNFKDHLDKRLDSKEIMVMKEQAELENESLQTLRHDIAAAIAKHMEETGMGVNELTRKLGISPSQAAKIRKGQANLTVASIAHVAAFLGKKAHLIFN